MCVAKHWPLTQWLINAVTGEVEIVVIRPSLQMHMVGTTNRARSPGVCIWFPPFHKQGFFFGSTIPLEHSRKLLFDARS